MQWRILKMIELQDIFEQFASEYIKNHNLPVNQLKVISAIEFCRTAKLGGHVDECDSCGHTRISYNSCRNRHCPKCQTLAKEKWLLDRRDDLLPVGYFHIVFTLPDSLNPIIIWNQEVMYSILFQATSETLQELSKDPKFLGAQIGFTTILHTWGQNLMLHPHTHNIVPAGGLSLDGTQWINSRKKFFIPVKVLSRKFRGKFISLMKKAYYSNKLKFSSEIENLQQESEFETFIEPQYKKEWVVFCKPPFKTPEHVLQYLGRYTHRVAISNSRIVSLENGQVTFKWKDYREKGKNKLMTLDVHEFIRRFLLHVLPSKFVKIRHYGILSNRNRHTKLTICKGLLNVPANINVPSWKELNTVDLIKELFGIDITLCPHCGKGKMVTTHKLDANNHHPPVNP